MRCLVCQGVRGGVDVIHNTYTYYKCAGCATSQVLPQPSEAELTAYYHQFHLSAKAGGVYAEFEDRMQADFAAKCKYVKKHTTDDRKTVKLLDVGCGKGFFVKQALSQGLEAEGIDVSASAIEYARKQLRIRAHQVCVETFQHSNKEKDRKSTRLNSSRIPLCRMPSSA